MDIFVVGSQFHYNDWLHPDGRLFTFILNKMNHLLSLNGKPKKLVLEKIIVFGSFFPGFQLSLFQNFAFLDR